MTSAVAENQLFDAARSRSRLVTSAFAAAVTVGGILLANPQSLPQFVVFFCAWNAIILVLNREDLPQFAFAFLVNSAFIAVFVAVQSSIYPDTYGTTSPLSSSWTDDSYFFTLAADSFPADLLSRENYWHYTHTFPTLIRALTPLPIEHPLDALFFQSGIAAVLSTFTRRLVLQLSGGARVADTAYVLVLICPFLMMNGGVILLRDTFAAALLVYSICCLNSRRFVLAAGAIALQLAVRPGTGLILLPAYGVLYFREIATFVRRHPLLVAGGATLAVFAIYTLADLLLQLAEQHIGVKSVGFLGRELITDLNADPNANALFNRIQEMPFAAKLVLNAGYIFSYPFLSMRSVLSADTFDIRNVAMNLAIPIYSYWLNAWFFAGVLSSVRAIEKQRAIVYVIAVILILVGSYSLQTRHKTIIYPLYYIIVAVGFRTATPLARRWGYLLATVLLGVQIAAGIR